MTRGEAFYLGLVLGAAFMLVSVVAVAFVVTW